MPIKKHGMWNTPTYKTWQQMKQRCDKPSSVNYADYGGKGITYPEHWKDFSLFVADVGIRPIGHSLDRINNSLGYSKENCKWSTSKEQANNRSNNVRVIWDGQIVTPNELVQIWQRPLATVFSRIYSFFTLNQETGLYEQTSPIKTRNRNKN